MLLLKICPSCHKRKLFLSRRMIKIKNLPPIKPVDPLCRKCLLALEKIDIHNETCKVCEDIKNRGDACDYMCEREGNPVGEECKDRCLICHQHHSEGENSTCDNCRYEI